MIAGRTTRELAVAALSGLPALELRIRDQHPIDVRAGQETLELAVGGRPVADVVVREVGELLSSVEIWTEDPAISARILRELRPVLS